MRLATALQAWCACARSRSSSPCCSRLSPACGCQHRMPRRFVRPPFRSAGSRPSSPAFSVWRQCASQCCWHRGADGLRSRLAVLMGCIACTGWPALGLMQPDTRPPHQPIIDPMRQALTGWRGIARRWENRPSTRRLRSSRSRWSRPFHTDSAGRSIGFWPSPYCRSPSIALFCFASTTGLRRSASLSCAPYHSFV